MAKKPQGKRSKAPSPPVAAGRRKSSRVVANAEAPAPKVVRQPYRGRARVEPPAPKLAERRPSGRPCRVAAPEAAQPVEAAPSEGSRPNRPGRPRRGAEPAPIAAPEEPEERRRSRRGRRAVDPVPQPVAAQVAEPVEEPPREEVAVQAALPVQMAPPAGNRGRRPQRVVEEPVELVELPGVAGGNEPPRGDELMIIDIVDPPDVIEIDGPAGVPRRDDLVQQRRNQERAWSESSDSDIEVIAHINRRRPRMVIELDHEEVGVPVAPMVVELEPINAMYSTFGHRSSHEKARSVTETKSVFSEKMERGANEGHAEPRPLRRREGRPGQPRAIDGMAMDLEEDIERMEAEMEAGAARLELRRNQIQMWARDMDRIRRLFQAEMLRLPRHVPQLVENVVAEEPDEVNNVEVEEARQPEPDLDRRVFDDPEERERSPSPIREAVMPPGAVMPPVPVRPPVPPEVADRINLILQQAQAEMEEDRNRRRRVPIQEVHNAGVNVNEENPEPRLPERREEPPRAIGGMAPRRPLPPLHEYLDRIEAVLEAAQDPLVLRMNQIRMGRDRPLFQAEILRPPRQELQEVENVIAEAAEPDEVNIDYEEEERQQTPPPLAIPRNNDDEEERIRRQELVRRIEEEIREEQRGDVRENQLAPEPDLDRRVFGQPEERERSPSPIREVVMPPAALRPPAAVRRRRPEPPEVLERINLRLQQAEAELQEIVRNRRARVPRVNVRQREQERGLEEERILHNPEPHPPARDEVPPRLDYVRAIGGMAPRRPLQPLPEDLERIEAEVEAAVDPLELRRDQIQMLARGQPLFQAQMLRPPMQEPAVVENVVAEAAEPDEMNNDEVQEERQQTPPPLAIPRNDDEEDERRRELMRRMREPPPEVIDRINLILQQARADMEEVRNERVPIQEGHNAGVNVNEENPEPRPPERRERGPIGIGGMAPRRPPPPLHEDLDRMEAEVEANEAVIRRNQEEGMFQMRAGEDRDMPVFQAEILRPPRQEPEVLENVVAEAEEPDEMNNDEVEEDFQRIIPRNAAEADEIIEGLMRRMEEEEREEQRVQIQENQLVPDPDDEEGWEEDFPIPPAEIRPIPPPELPENDRINLLLQQAQEQMIRALDDREERIQQEVQQFARNRGPRVPIQDIHNAMVNARQRERERELEEQRLLQLEDVNPDEGVEDLIDVVQFLRENADVEQEPHRNRYIVIGNHQQPVLFEADRLRTRQRKLPESEELHLPYSVDSAWYRWSEYDVMDWASKFIRSNGNTQLLKNLEMDGLKLKSFLSKRNQWARVGMPYGMYIQLKGHFNRVLNYVSGFSYP
ncbi:hypothetical protein GCK72_013235 [Caenorhabditis remanei]|uniref:Uncharacterized protein n=1 Tax=Caenorhabditis remanei TaxID=31234 RepID=A0A6A5GQ26_CAERE|nr:hypothetical protein GCK72_013235 [Caenorhabditis remanei]KAF1756781.1 hypothetical protein GCK72_013235 [Caenorhabditis remanei]